MVDITLSGRLNQVEVVGDSDEHLRFDNLIGEVRQLEAENEALKDYAKNIIKCLYEYEDSQTSEEYKQTLDDFHHGVFLLSEGIAKL